MVEKTEQRGNDGRGGGGGEGGGGIVEEDLNGGIGI